MFDKLTIGRRLNLGFGVFIGLTITAFILTLLTLSSSRTTTENVIGKVTPSVAALKEFNFLLQRSQTLISKWYYSKDVNDPGRVELEKLIATDYIKQKQAVTRFTDSWKKSELDTWKRIIGKADTLFLDYRSNIMEPLVNLESYNDPGIYFVAENALRDAESNLNDLYQNLNALITQKQKSASDENDNLLNSFRFLEWFVKFMGLALVIGGIAVALFTARSIVKPVHELKGMILTMAKGILPKTRIPERKDEIGEMSNALTELIHSMERTTDFAKATGMGDFDASFKPLSGEDTLGMALLKMREDLAENERILERKVEERTEEVVRQKSEIERKSIELEEVYLQLKDSIHYAKRIQDTILPTSHKVKRLLPNAFVLFKPKDIVSGDFYWIEEKNDWIYFAAVDCTGHGVPGAFMSLLGYNNLKDILKNAQSITPAEILNQLRDNLMSTLSAEGSAQTKDGMDITLCAINFKTRKLQYAAAFNPLIMIRNEAMEIYPANKFPVGFHHGDKQAFDNHEMELHPGDQIFVFSDGYADQFGGPNGKKFMAGNFKRLLQKISTYDSFKQKEVLNTTLMEWQGVHEQVDDVLVIGVKMI